MENIKYVNHFTTHPFICCNWTKSIHMFSNKSFKYLRSLSSTYLENKTRPAQFENEFIIYSEMLVKGLNFDSSSEFYLEHALPNREDHDAMTGLILHKGQSLDDPYIQVRATSDGNFFLELHASYKDSMYLQFGREASIQQKIKDLYDIPGFSRYYTVHTDTVLSSNHHFCRFEMPLRQLRSRNLVEYSIFVLNQAKPFLTLAQKVKESQRQVAAA